MRFFVFKIIKSDGSQSPLAIKFTPLQTSWTQAWSTSHCFLSSVCLITLCTSFKRWMLRNKPNLLTPRCRNLQKSSSIFWNVAISLLYPSPLSHWDWQSCWHSVVSTLTVWTFLSCFSGVFIGCLITCVFTWQFVALPERKRRMCPSIMIRRDSWSFQGLCSISLMCCQSKEETKQMVVFKSHSSTWRWRIMMLLMKDEAEDEVADVNSNCCRPVTIL